MDPLPFIPNQIYHRRNEIHAHYGGSIRSGITNTTSYPFIFIFYGESGHRYGYFDKWDNDYVFSYTGAGRIGDMEFKRGNLALLNHKKNGKRVLLFKIIRKAYVQFEGEVELITFNTQDLIDSLGSTRVGITFFFKRSGVYLPLELEQVFNDHLIKDPSIPYSLNMPNETERKGLITTRIGQGAYRERVLLRWNNKCAVTDFGYPKILIASHIVPWSESSHEQRLDPENGILLSPTYDALFDRHLITFENTGKIILSDAIAPHAYKKLGVSGLEKIKNLHEDNHPYLEKHRQRFHDHS